MSGRKLPVHDTLYFGPQDTQRFTAKNVSGSTLLIGDCTILAAGNTDASTICVNITKTTTTTIRAKAAGCVYGTRIETDAVGEILFDGITTSVKVHGAITNGYMLELSTITPGAAVQVTAAAGTANYGKSRVFALAGTNDAGTHLRLVTAYLLPYRV